MWVRDNWGLQGGNQTGGDIQCTDGYSVRFLMADDSGRVVPREHTDHRDPRHGPLGEGRTEYLYSWVEICLYGVARWNDDGEIELDEDGQPIIWLQRQTETMVAAGPAEPGDWPDPTSWEERDSRAEYEELDHFCESVEAAGAMAKTLAGQYLTDYPDLIHRDVDWDGLAEWEKTAWLR